jgi:probable phosphoglycerate mutase
MTIVLLVRHGENDYVKKGRLAGRLAGVHLNEKGRAQAQAVADKLAGATIKAVYSSPLERTMETAQPIAIALGVEVIPREGLVEINFGEWTDQKLKGLSRLKLWKVVQNFPSMARFPGGETFREAQCRVVEEINSLAGMYEPKDIIVCVSHSDTIKLAVAFYIGLPLDMFQRLMVSPGSINVLNVGEASSSLLALNYDLSFSLPKPDQDKKRSEK